MRLIVVVAFLLACGALVVASRDEANPSQRSTMQQRAVDIIAAEDAANPPELMSAAECAEFRAQHAGWDGIPCNQGDPVPSADEEWNQTTLAFERSHPALKLWHNIAIMQDKVNMFAQPGMTTREILEKSYMAATLTTGWTAPVADPAPVAGQVIWDDLRPEPPAGYAYEKKSVPPAPPGKPSYVQRVSQDAQRCQSNGGNIMECYAKASPSRCKAAAVAFIGNRDVNRRAWGLCLQSCGDADLWDRTVGDCRK